MKVAGIQEGEGNTVWGTEKNSEGNGICLGKKCEKLKPIWISFTFFSITELCLVLVYNDFPSTTYLKIDQCFHQSLCTCSPDSVFKMQLLRITQDSLHFFLFSLISYS